MRRNLLLLPLLILLVSLTAERSAAQYLYMDSNGNGVHDAGDRVKKKGPTTVDVYLNTTQNRDGSAVTCINPEPPASTLHLFSFGLCLRAVGGTMSWGELTAPASFTLLFSLLSTPTEHHVFYGLEFGAPWLEPGLHHLGRLQVTALSGRPSLEFAPRLVREDGFPETTHFGTPCPGTDFDNTYKLGSDFLDSDGLAASGGPSAGAAVVLGTTSMSSTAKLAFETSRAGLVRVQLFDVQGRLVRTVMDQAILPLVRHEIPLDGRGDNGQKLASGIYFYRIARPEGAVSGRFAITR